MMKTSISLIGMAGAGKSSIGEELARSLNLEFVDSDLVIEQKYGKSLQDILSQNGHERFKEIEEESLLSINFKGIVLATGGSAVFSKKAMQFIKENSIVIYLDATYQDITERVSNFSERGLIKRPDQTVEEAYKERKELYKQFADHTIKNDETINSCVNEILELIKHN